MRTRLALLLGAASCLGLAQPGIAQVAPGDWTRFARDMHGDRYSPLNQINTANVDKLSTAWAFKVAPQGGGGIANETTPLAIDGVLYVPVGKAVVALDGVTGQEIWRHILDSGIARRAVSYWPGDKAHPPRLYYSDGKDIVAIDMKTGQTVTSFGDNGKVALDPPDGGPPTVYKDVLIIGASVAEMPIGPSGDTRAFDAITGKPKWVFHTVPRPGEVGHETWLDNGWKGRSGTNVWVWYMNADPETNTLYMSVGGPSPNYYGGDRPGADLFGNSIVAVDPETGKLKWYFQTIHHDLWDSDLPAPPTLIDIHKDGKTIPALAETGKPAFMYILNRNTGKPIFGVKETPVPKADVPGEWYSPTQPIPVKPEHLVRSTWTPADVVSPEDTTPAHSAACHALMDKYGGFWNGGPFSPFWLYEPGKTKLKATIRIPSNGGSNWGGTAADPTTGLLYINTSEQAAIGFIEKRKPHVNYGRGDEDSPQLYDRASLSAPGAYTGFNASYTDANGKTVNLPCIKPPWGRLFAINAATGDIVWQTRLGVSDDLPAGKQDTGRYNELGGPIVTAGGLVFIGGTDDHRFRAFDAKTGKELWTQKLEYGAQALPITYRGKDGRQYVAVMSAAGGGEEGPDGKPDDNQSLIAFALPELSEPNNMKLLKTALLAAAALTLAAPTLAQPITPPADVKPARPVFTANFMNIFRRFSPDIRDKMVEFYNQVLGLQALTPIQLSKTQQMLLFKVGAGQIKLASGLNAGRDYHPGGALNATTGIRLITLYFPDEAALKASFKAHGYPEPEFKDIGGGRKAALVTDPGGFRLELIVWPNAPAETYGRINVGINASDLKRSEAFYRDFVGLDELPPEHDRFLGVTKYPFRHGTTTIDLWSVGHDLPKDTGSAGIQYITSNVEAINALAQERHITVETPLGGVRGFNVVTVWLNDPDGVTDYFYELGPGGRRGPPPGAPPPAAPAAPAN